MANVTEKDIIEHLKEKIRFHQNEAQRLENVLSAFTGESPTQPGRRSKADAAAEALANNAASAPVTGKGRKATKEKTSETATPPKPLEVPAKYTDDLTINAKIAFALNEIGSGFNEDIAGAMAQYEPKSDAQTISRQISGVLSTLKSKGQLKTEKVGRKDKYSLA